MYGIGFLTWIPILSPVYDHFDGLPLNPIIYTYYIYISSHSMNFPQEHSIPSNPNPIQSPWKITIISKPSDHHFAHHSIIKSPFELGFFGGFYGRIDENFPHEIPWNLRITMAGAEMLSFCTDHLFPALKNPQVFRGKNGKLPAKMVIFHGIRWLKETSKWWFHGDSIRIWVLSKPNLERFFGESWCQRKKMGCHPSSFCEQGKSYWC